MRRACRIIIDGQNSGVCAVEQRRESDRNLATRARTQIGAACIGGNAEYAARARQCHTRDGENRRPGIRQKRLTRRRLAHMGIGARQCRRSERNDGCNAIAMQRDCLRAADAAIGHGEGADARTGIRRFEGDNQLAWRSRREWGGATAVRDREFTGGREAGNRNR